MPLVAKLEIAAQCRLQNKLRNKLFFVYLAWKIKIQYIEYKQQHLLSIFTMIVILIWVKSQSIQGQQTRSRHRM